MNQKRTTKAAFAMAAAFLVLLVAVLVLRGLPGRDVVEALGPIAVLPDNAAEDRAADPRDGNDDGRRFLPVPALLDDDRVVDALGPLGRLSCRRGERTGDDDVPGGAPRDDPLDAPLASWPDDANAWGTQPLVTAALAPLAILPLYRALRTGDAVQAGAAAASCPALLRHRFNRLQSGESQSLCQFRGKVLLIVNTASYCGYTGQYERLEALYRRYRGRGLVVVGFPSNDFGGQEPGSNPDIAEFCRLTYGVLFPMFEKSSVTRVSSNPLFAELAASTGVPPRWNFYKYVIDRHGQAIAGYDSRTTPDDPQLIALLERLLMDRRID